MNLPNYTSLLATNAIPMKDNAAWNQDFRSRLLRPSSELRKFTSRRFPPLDRLLPPARLPIDHIERIRLNPRRVEHFRRALELGIFNCTAYLDESAEARASGLNPLHHFLIHDWPRRLVSQANPHFIDWLDAAFPEQADHITRPDASKSPTPVRPAGPRDAREANPLVSVVIVNLNGRRHLADLFASLAEQTYRNHELILIDNDSSDDSVAHALTLCPRLRVCRVKRNVGFAEANNIAHDIAKGRLLCLLNNDTRVDAQWLNSLVTTWQSSADIAAVCSKLLFWHPFIEIRIRGLNPELRLRVSRTCLDKFHPDYVKTILRTPTDVYRDENNTEWLEFSGEFRVLLPLTGACIWLADLHSIATCDVEIKIGAQTSTRHLLSAGVNQLTFEIDPVRARPRPLLNNAGSAVDDSLSEVRDIGINEFDEGQYDVPATLTAVCGCSLLVDTACLDGHPLFCAAFFAYYEDTELSIRLRRAGWRLVYAPGSVVHHRHASSSGEGSKLFRHLLQRNRLYFFLLHAEAEIKNAALATARIEFAHLATLRPTANASPAGRDDMPDAARLLMEVNDFQTRVASGRAYEREILVPRIAVYDAYWRTAGGGEHHALMFALYFSRLGPVDLIGEVDFDLQALAAAFDLNLKNCRKLIYPFVDRELTANYDIFVNSTYHSSAPSDAKHSYYVVSFPHQLNLPKRDLNEFLGSYRFLANSHYTRKWIEAYWKSDSHVVYPSVEISQSGDVSLKREKIILHVGRFFRGGHNKKQAELAVVFAELKHSGRISGEWRLVLAGRVDPQHLDYPAGIRTRHANDGVEVLNDLEHGKLTDLYTRASVYWHATGLNEDPDSNPEKFEHFGITNCEAMAAGCIPIAYRVGGPGEVITHGADGYVFSNSAELAGLTVELLKACEQSDPKVETMRKAAINTAGRFSRDRFLAELASIHPAEGNAVELL